RLGSRGRVPPRTPAYRLAVPSLWCWPVMHLDGAYCDAASKSFVIWSAVPNANETQYRVHQQPYRLVSEHVTPATALPPPLVLRRLDPVDSTVPLDPAALPQRSIASCGGTL